MKAKEAELENTGADLLFLEEYSEEGVAFLSEEHNLPVLLGEDWDRNDFPGETVLKTSSYLYGKDTLASSPNIAEPKESVSEEESREEGSRERLMHTAFRKPFSGLLFLENYGNTTTISETPFLTK